MSCWYLANLPGSCTAVSLISTSGREPSLDWCCRRVLQVTPRENYWSKRECSSPGSDLALFFVSMPAKQPFFVDSGLVLAFLGESAALETWRNAFLRLLRYDFHSWSLHRSPSSTMLTITCAPTWQLVITQWCAMPTARGLLKLSVPMMTVNQPGASELLQKGAFKSGRGKRWSELST